MSIGIFILFFLQPSEPGCIEVFTYYPFVHQSMFSEKRSSGVPHDSMELLDDFDKNPNKPEDKWIAMDKFWHWAMAFALTGSSYHFIHNQLQSPDPEAMAISISSVVVFSLAKEFYDLATYGHFSGKDLCYDALGIATGYMAFIWDWNSED